MRRLYLVADAHVVYDHLYRGGEIIEVGCWSHTRRYFFNALASDPDRAKVALAYLTALFRLERTIADDPRKKKEAVRDKRSRPIVQDFFNWCEAERDLVLDDSPSPRPSVTPSISAKPSSASSTTVACR